MSMLDPIVGFFDKLIDQFTWRRLLFLAATILVLAMGLWAYESYTQHFKLTRLERQVELLKELGEVASSQEVKSNPELLAISKSIAKQLKDTDITMPVNYELLPWAKKALAAGVAWVVFGLFIALIPNSYTSTRPATGSVIAGMTVVASPFIALAIAMPTEPWINYAAYPIGHIFALGIFLSWFTQKISRKYATPTQ